MTAQSSLIVFGASGHAKVVIDAIALEGRHGVAGICVRCQIEQRGGTI